MRRISLEVQVETLMIFLMIFLVVKEEVAVADLIQFLKICLVVAVADLDSNEVQICYMKHLLH